MATEHEPREQTARKRFIDTSIPESERASSQQFLCRGDLDPDVIRFGIEREHRKTWIYAGLAALALILSAIVMIVGVGLDPEGASLSVTDWARYRGGPAGVFILASMWFAYLGRPKVHIGK